MGFMLTSTSGLVAFVLIAATIFVPYASRWIIRRLRPNPGTYSSAIKFHQTLGYTILALVFAHMYMSIGGGMMMRMNSIGLDCAMLGLLLLVLQTALGFSRPRSGSSDLIIWRRMHFTVMLGIAGLVLVHVWLNGMLIYGYLRFLGL